MTHTIEPGVRQNARLFFLVPDVGTHVAYQDEEWEVSGWLRAVCGEDRQGEPALESGYGILMQIEHEDCELAESERLVFCSRDKATHVSLRGTGGVVVRIEDCKVLRATSCADKRNELKRIANGLIGVEIF